jgi:cyclase
MNSSYLSCLTKKPAEFVIYVLTASILLSSAIQLLNAQEITAQRLSQNITIIQGGGGNMTVVITDDGIVVVDTFVSPAAAGKARKIIEKLTDRPIRYVINTHFHADHSYGNQIFSDAVIIGFHDYEERATARYGEDRLASLSETIISLEKQLEAADTESGDFRRLEDRLNAVRNLKKDSEHFVLTKPDIELKGNAAICLEGKNFEIFHFGRAHTDSDLVIFVPEEKLLVTGDICWNSYICYIDPVESDPLNWIAALDNLLSLRDEVEYIVPGHGDPGGTELLKTQRNFLLRLWEEVRAVRTRGHSLEQAKQEITLEEYKDYVHYESSVPFIIESCWRIQERSKVEKECLDSKIRQVIKPQEQEYKGDK